MILDDFSLCENPRENTKMGPPKRILNGVRIIEYSEYFDQSECRIVSQPYDGSPSFVLNE